MKILLRKLRLWLALWLVRRYGQLVVPRSRYTARLNAIRRARSLTFRSGHLTRAYHVGRQLRRILSVT